MKIEDSERLLELGLRICKDIDEINSIRIAVVNADVKYKDRKMHSPSKSDLSLEGKCKILFNHFRGVDF